jgi:hypothetical protein
MVVKVEEIILNLRSSELEKRRTASFSTLERVPAGMVLNAASATIEMKAAQNLGAKQKGPLISDKNKV